MYIMEEKKKPHIPSMLHKDLLSPAAAREDMWALHSP